MSNWSKQVSANLRNSNDSVPKEEFWVRYNVLIVKWAHIHVQRVGNMHSSYYMYWWMLISCVIWWFQIRCCEIQSLKCTIYHKRKFSNYFSLILKVLWISTMLFCLFSHIKIRNLYLEISISFPIAILLIFIVYCIFPQNFTLKLSSSSSSLNVFGCLQSLNQRIQYMYDCISSRSHFTHGTGSDGFWRDYKILSLMID